MVMPVETYEEHDTEDESRPLGWYVIERCGPSRSDSPESCEWIGKLTRGRMSSHPSRVATPEEVVVLRLAGSVL
jgi:hypothetical protein